MKKKEKSLKEKRQSNKNISIILLTSAIWALLIALLGFANQYTNVKTISFEFASPQSIVYITNKNIDKGSVITEKDFVKKEIDTKLAVKSNLKSYKQILGKQATHTLYANEQITLSDVIEPAIVKDDLVSYTIPITLNVLHDSNIRTNSYVDVVVDFKEKDKKIVTVGPGKTQQSNINKPSQTVAGKVLVTQLIDNKGNPISTVSKEKDNDSNENSQPAFANVLVKRDLIVNLNDAKKRGDLTLIKYLDTDKEKTPEDYKPSWL